MQDLIAMTLKKLVKSIKINLKEYISQPLIINKHVLNVITRLKPNKACGPARVPKGKTCEYCVFDHINTHSDNG